jgi:ABC-type multidrug transport system fused ATPase/permease subunit
MEIIVDKLMRAPIDQFYDKHPIGRILNRLSADIGSIDYAFFFALCQSLGLVITYFLPVAFIHYSMPWYLTIAALPFYFFIFWL